MLKHLRKKHSHHNAHHIHHKHKKHFSKKWGILILAALLLGLAVIIPQLSKNQDPRSDAAYVEEDSKGSLKAYRPKNAPPPPIPVVKKTASLSLRFVTGRSNRGAEDPKVEYDPRDSHCPYTVEINLKNEQSRYFDVYLSTGGQGVSEIGFLISFGGNLYVSATNDTLKIVKNFILVKGPEYTGYDNINSVYAVVKPKSGYIANGNSIKIATLRVNPRVEQGEWNGPVKEKLVSIYFDKQKKYSGKPMTKVLSLNGSNILSRVSNMCVRLKEDNS